MVDCYPSIKNVDICVTPSLGKPLVSILRAIKSKNFIKGYMTNSNVTSLKKSWDEQKKAWRILKRIGSKEISLDTISLIRNCEIEKLKDQDFLASLISDIGLNDEGLEEFPTELHPYCGKGLHLWQYPAQFSPYLIKLSTLEIKSYLEIGIRHGGSFVMTTEYLSRFSALNRSIGVDILPCPSMPKYELVRPESKFYQLNSQSEEFHHLLIENAPIDLVFIDSHHEEHQCRIEIERIKPYVKMMAFHDIDNINCPGIKAVWNELKISGEYECHEFNRQFEGLGPYMGIGLAISNIK